MRLKLFIAIFALTAGVFVITWKHDHGPRPAIFAAGYSLAQAREHAAAEHKPVFAMATASWCAPCQVLKHGPLAEPEVEKYIGEHFVTAYVDVDDDRAGAEEMQAISIPLLVLYAEDGKEMRRLEGAVPTALLKAWMEGK